jgi:hypothetical protein
MKLGRATAKLKGTTAKLQARGIRREILDAAAGRGRRLLVIGGTRRPLAAATDEELDSDGLAQGGTMKALAVYVDGLELGGVSLDGRPGEDPAVALPLPAALFPRIARLERHAA